jgi:hypothetical protein
MAKEQTAKNVYQLIAAVTKALAHDGISKSRKNQQQGYSFRGIDDVYNALAPVLAEHELVILPRMLSREVVERTTQKGGVLFNVTVEAEFDFVSAADGSKHVVKTYGEAMDSADKATNKAMSAAYKYAAFQTFCIPTEGDNDADATTHGDIKPASSLPAGYEKWLSELDAFAEKHTDGELISEIAESGSDEFKALLRKDTATLSALRSKAGKNKKATVAA